MSLTLTLTFPGSCASAIELYQEAFSAKVLSKTLFSESSAELLPSLNSAYKNLIYRAELEICDTVVVACDRVTSRAPLEFVPMCAEAEMEDEEAVKKAFSVLKKMGRVLNEPVISPDSACSAEVLDRYGVRWILTSSKKPELTFTPLTKYDSACVSEIVKVCTGKSELSASSFLPENGVDGILMRRLR